MLWELPRSSLAFVQRSCGRPSSCDCFGLPRAQTGHYSRAHYVRLNVTIILLISVTLLIVATGTLHEQSGPAFLAALTAFLTLVLVAWLRALSIILVPEAD